MFTAIGLFIKQLFSGFTKGAVAFENTMTVLVVLSETGISTAEAFSDDAKARRRIAQAALDREIAAAEAAPEAVKAA